MEQAIIQFVLDMAQKYPSLAVVFIIVGVLRSVFKPLMTFIHAVVAATPSKNDDMVVEKVEASKVYKAIAWFIDYIASIKLPNYDK